jgi:hypothetical protein
VVIHTLRPVETGIDGYVLRARTYCEECDEWSACSVHATDIVKADGTIAWRVLECALAGLLVPFRPGRCSVKARDTVIHRLSTQTSR